MASSVASTSSVRPDTRTIVAWLAEERKRPSRRSAQTVEYGDILLESGQLAKLGDDVWAFLEQVCLAALDVGRWSLAELCVKRLDTRFPNSPRVAVLQGMLHEAQGELDKALKLYESLLERDQSNAVLSKRRVAVLKSLGDAGQPRGGADKAIAALVEHLDTFYADIEGWQELAAMYAEQHMYSQSLFALEELQLLSPQNSFFTLQLAETAYTAGELKRSYVAYLRVLEMCGGPPPKGDTRSGPWTRAVWGLKLTASRLLAGAVSLSGGSGSDGADGEVSGAGQERAKLEAVDELATRLLLDHAYAGSSAGVKASRDAVRRVLSSTATSA